MMTKLKFFLENGTRKLHPDCLKGMIRDHYKKNHSCCDEEWGDDDDGVVQHPINEDIVAGFVFWPTLEGPIVDNQVLPESLKW